MALPTLADAKAYCKVEHDQEDALLTALLARARGAVESYLNRPITAAERTMVIESPSSGLRTLMLPIYPVDAGALVIVDENGTTVPAADYRVSAVAGMIRRVDGGFWIGAPWTVTAPAGLSLHPSYAVVIEPVISAGIVDVVSDFYHNRNPVAALVSSAGVQKSLSIYLQANKDTGGLPPRVASALAQWRIGPRIN